MYELTRLQEVIKDSNGNPLRGSVTDKLTIGEIVVKLIEKAGTAEHVTAQYFMALCSEIYECIETNTHTVKLNPEIVDHLHTILSTTPLPIAVKAVVSSALIKEIADV